MKTKIMMLAATAVIAVAAPLAAQQKTANFPDNIFLKGQQQTQILARDALLFAKVRGADGKIIGDVEDFIMTEDMQVIGAIVGVGGFLGAGEKKIGVKLSAFKFTTVDGKTVVSLPTATRAALKELAPYQRTKPAQTMVERALEKARELSDKTMATSTDAYQKAKDASGPALEKAKEATKGVVDKAKEAAKPKTN
jgi:hypothetical protein